VFDAWRESPGKSHSYFYVFASNGASLRSGICLTLAMKSLDIMKTPKMSRLKMNRQEMTRNEEGSISVLTMGLFLITVALLILITDIASIAVSKQSLVHASESVAIRATHNVDLGAYYRGNSGVSVPIDCQQAYRKINSEFGDWLESDGEIRRTELKDVRLTDFSCSGNRVLLSSSALAVLPLRLPAFPTTVEIHTTVEAESDRMR
jgi:hypothetical protein